MVKKRGSRFKRLLYIRFRINILSLFVLIGCFYSFGQEIRKEVCVEFPIGRSMLDASYGDNAARLSELELFLSNVMNDESLELLEISLCGSASPDGGFNVNRRLALERSVALENYVREHVTISDDIISRCEGFIAWERLTELVENSDMPHKAEAVDVLRNVPESTYDDNGVLVDSRKKHLMELQYGRTWNYMYRYFFGEIRNASVILVTVIQKPEVKQELQEEKTEALPPTDELVADEPETIMPIPEVITPFYMALKSNMLYDLLAVPNVGAEFYLGKNWSVGGNWMYGWWDKDSKHRYWRIYGGDLSVRKWFGEAANEKPLTGHHLGVYGQIFTYDFEFGGKGYMGGKPGGTLWDKMNYAMGVEYGYSLPIARRLNVDFNIGVGYWGGKYYEYTPLDGHYVWQATKNRHWFGPTKAEVSLVWLVGRGNYNKEKGRRR